MANKDVKKSGQNITIHVLAILLAIALWSYVKTADLSARPETSVSWDSVALEIRDIPVGLRLTNRPPETVSVLLRGNDSIVGQVLKENLLAYVSLADASEGMGQYAVKVIHPQGLNATPTPGRIEVRLERELTADYNIRIEGLDRHNPGFYVDASVTPTFVRVSGLRSLFEQVQYAQVVVDQASITESGLWQLPVRLIDSAGNEIVGLVVDPGVADVNVTYLPGKLVPISIDLVDELPDGYELSAEIVGAEHVYLYALPEVLAEIEEVSTAPISLLEIVEDTTLKVDLVIPEEVEVYAFRQVEVSLTVTEETE